MAVALSPDGPAIGECDLSEIDRHHARAEVGFLFARRYWGQGYAREAMEAAVARARGRHARLLKSAGQAMVGDSQVAMRDLVNRGEG